jgi:hypothetical protein
MIGHLVQQNPNNPCRWSAQLFELGLAQLFKNRGNRLLNNVVEVRPTETPDKGNGAQARSKFVMNLALRDPVALSDSREQLPQPLLVHLAR